MDTVYVAQNLKMLLPLTYIIPSYILYFAIIYNIFVSKNRKELNVSFYKLFGISAVVYLFCSVIYFVAVRIPNTPLFIPFVKLWGEQSFFVTFLQVALWYVTNVTPLFHLAISFNRFTVFILEIHYEKFWKKWLYIIAGICLVFPVCFIWHIPFQGIYIQLNNPSDPNNSLRYIAASNRDVISWMNNPRNAAIIIIITSSLSLVFNLYCVVRLVCEKYFWKKLNRKKTSKQDILLIGYTMLVFACDVLHCLHQCTILTITNQATIDMMFEVQYYLFDISDLAPAWFILITNKNLFSFFLQNQIKACFQRTIKKEIYCWRNT